MLISVLPVLFLFLSSNQTFAQAKEKSIAIKTEFHCGGGKAKIESEIAKLDGVNSVVADLGTKVVTIIYDPAKQNKKKLVSAIEATGHKTEFTKKGKGPKEGCGTHEKEGKKCGEV